MGLSGASGAAEPGLSLRELPTLKVAWHRGERATALAVDAGMGFILTRRTLVAVNAANGETLWISELAGKRWGCELMQPLGYVVAVGCAEDLHLLSRDTGRLLWTRTMDHRIWGLAGPPLVVAASGGCGDPGSLYAVDTGTGEITAERGRFQSFQGLELREGVAVVIGSSCSPSFELMAGLRPDTLELLWREEFEGFRKLPGYAEPLVLAGESAPDVASWRLEELDPLSGVHEASVPEWYPLAPEAEGSGRWGGLTREARQLCWLPRSHKNPAEPTCVIASTDAERYLHTNPSRGRGVFLVVDSATGDIVATAAGLRSPLEMEVAGELLVLRTEADGVLAFSRHEFGQPESVSHPVSQEALRILGRIEAADAVGLEREIEDGLAEMGELGQGAAATVATEVPRLRSHTLVAAARFLAAQNHRCAAHALAARLTEPLPALDIHVSNPDAAVEILLALAEIGGPAEVPAVAAVLRDPSREPSQRRAALFALAAIGSPEAWGVVDHALARARAPAERWWQGTPDPTPFLEFAGLTLAEQGVEEELLFDTEEASAEDYENHLLGSVSLSIPTASGFRLIVFPAGPAGWYAGHWISVVTADRKVLTTSYSGMTWRQGRTLCGRLGMQDPSSCPALQGAVDEELVTIWTPELPRRIVSFRRDELVRDSDHDGLSDLFERRLYCSPHNADTDGDGLADPEDPAPNATIRGLPREEDRIADAIFTQYFMFPSPRPGEHIGHEGLLYVLSPRALEWHGRQGPVITVDRDLSEGLARTEDQGIWKMWMAPLNSGETGNHRALKRLRPLQPNECVYELVMSTSLHASYGMAVVLRKINGRWFIREMHGLWIS